MDDRFFTIVCDYRGGTYIAQVNAPDQNGALLNWADYLRKERPFGRSSSWMAKAITADKDYRPSAITGLSKVWCMSTLCGGTLVIWN